MTGRAAATSAGVRNDGNQPSANPPTKKPIMTLMKQARAFGVGVVLATQNPVDVDYKALSNAGTWMVGRLLTPEAAARVRASFEPNGGFATMGARRLT